MNVHCIQFETFSIKNTIKEHCAYHVLISLIGRNLQRLWKTHIREKDQQDEYLFLIIYLNYVMLDTFRTNNCSSLGGIYKQLTVFHNASSLVTDTIRISVSVVS
jgi:hypothetical protein